VGVVGVLALAAAWRIAMAALLPVISRDGVTFCWYARELGRSGLDYLQAPAAQQHPGFPTLVLGAAALAQAVGAPDGPWTWQRCGQGVSIVSGLVVIGLVGLLTARLVRGLILPVDRRLTVMLAMLLAALLDLNVWLSADVMSEQVHLAFYLGAVVLLTRLDAVRAAAGCGLLSGLAFLTREEGFVPVLAGLLTLATAWRGIPGRRLAKLVATLLAGFLVCAAPYWLTVGRFSTKKGVSDLWESAGVRTGVEMQGAPPPSAWGAWASGPYESRGAGTRAGGPCSPACARLKTLDLSWYALLPHAFYKLFRAGRVVVPLLAVIPLVNLRRRWLKPPLVGPLACAAGHFGLAVLVLAGKGYLDPRHMLVPVVLLIPFAALLLGRLVTLAAEARRPWLGVVAVLVCVAPLVRYALRVPNSKDRFLADAAAWLNSHDPQAAAKRLLTAGSPRRIAFYTDMRWEVWDDQPVNYEELAGKIRRPEPGYFAIQVPTDPGHAQYEFEGNDELLARLLTDPGVAPCLRPVQAVPGPDRSELRIFELVPPGGK
jgi:hypothetical protein